MNIIGVSNFVFKRLYRSCILILGFIATLYFMVVRYANTEFIEFISAQEFSLLAIIVTMIITVLFVLRNDENEIEYLMSNKFHYALSVILASVKLGFLILIIPFFITLASGFKSNRQLLMNGMIEFVLVYAFSVIAISVFTAVVCVLVKSNIKRLTFMVGIFYITSPFTNVLAGGNKFLKVLFHGFNIQEDKEFISTGNYLGFNHDIRYILDKIIMIIILAFIIYMTYVILEKKSKKIMSIVGIVTSFIVLGLVGISASTFDIYASSVDIDEESVYSNYEGDIEILSYDMNLDIGYKVNNKVNMSFKNLGEDTKNTDFVLDNLFEVKNVKYEGKEINFTHKENILSLNMPMKNGEKKDVEITYEGRVTIEDDLGYPVMVVNSSRIDFASNIVAWYPRGNNSNKIDFNVDLNGRDGVVSNFENNQGILKGRAKELIIIDANIESVEHEGYKILTEVDNYFLEYDLKKIDEFIKNEKVTYLQMKEIKERKEILILPSNRLVHSSEVKIIDGLIVVG